MDASLGSGGVLDVVQSCAFLLGRQESVLGLARDLVLPMRAERQGSFRVEIVGKEQLKG